MISICLYVDLPEEGKVSQYLKTLLDVYPNALNSPGFSRSQ